VAVGSSGATFQQSSSITGANFAFSNGGAALFSYGEYDLSGMITGSGEGSVQIAVSGAFTTKGSDTATLDFSGDSTVELSAGGAIGGSSNAITNAGNFLWSDGYIAYSGGLANTGTMSISATGAHIIAGASLLTNHGTITQTGASSVQLMNSSGSPASAAILANASDGTYNFTGDGGFTGSGTVNNAGLIEKTGGTGVSTIASGITFNSTGRIEVDSGTLAFQGNGSIAGGNFSFSNGAVAAFSAGSFALSGLITGSGNGSLQIYNSLGTNSSGAATLNFQPGDLIWNGGGIYNSGIVNAGSMTVTGTNAIATYALAIGSGALFTNNGTITQTGTSIVQVQGTLANASGGTYNLTGDGGFTGYGIFNNAGAFEKIGGTGVSNIASGFTFNSTGRIEVDSGALAFQGNGSIAGGNFSFSNGGVAAFSAGSFTLSGLITGSGNGSLQIYNSLGTNSSGAATLNFQPGNFSWNGGGIYNGQIVNAGSMTVTPVTGANALTIWSGALLTNNGTITQTGASTVLLQGTLVNASAGTYNLTGDGGLTGYGIGAFNNAGLFEKTGGAGVSTIASAITFNNTGRVEVDSGTLFFQKSVSQVSGNTLTGGTWVVNGASALSIAYGVNITVNQGNVTLSGPGANFTNLATLSNNQGSLTLLKGQTFVTNAGFANSGSVSIGANSEMQVNGTFVQTSTGTLSGSGAVAGNVTASGMIAPDRLGILTIAGNLTLNSDATFDFDIGTISVQGNVVLNGATLSLAPELGATVFGSNTKFTLLTYGGTESGVFDYNGSPVTDGGMITFGVNTFELNYDVGDPSIVLTSVNAVPEASTTVLIVLGAGFLAFRIRRAVAECS
jgi:hypothetical protein